LRSLSVPNDPILIRACWGLELRSLGAHRFHTRDYFAKIKKLSAEGGGNAGYAPFGTGSFEIAQRAVGGCASLASCWLPLFALLRAFPSCSR
jgi:hypothetical protein